MCPLAGLQCEFGERGERLDHDEEWLLAMIDPVDEKVEVLLYYSTDSIQLEKDEEK